MNPTYDPAIYYTTLDEFPEGLLVLGKDIHALSSRFPLGAAIEEPYIREVIFEDPPIVFCEGKTFFLHADAGYRLGHTYDLRLTSTYEKLRGNYNPNDVRFLVDAYHLFLGSATFRKRADGHHPNPRKMNCHALKKIVRRLQNSHPDSIRFILVGALLRECQEMIELVVKTVSCQVFEEALPKTPFFPVEVRKNLVHCGSIISWLHSKCVEEDSDLSTPYRKLWEAYWHISMIPSLVIHTIEAEKWEDIGSLRSFLISQHVRNLRGEVKSSTDSRTVRLNICLTRWLLRLFEENQVESAHQIAHWARHTLPLIHYHMDTIRSHVTAGQYPSLQDTICMALIPA